MTTTTASQPDNLGTLRNRTFDEIAVGDWAGSCAIALMLAQHYRGTPP